MHQSRLPLCLSPGGATMTLKRCGHRVREACCCHEESEYGDLMDRQPDVLTFMASNHGTLRQRTQMRRRVDLEQPED